MALITVGAFDTPGSARDVEVVGGLAYVASPSGLRIIDVSNPAAPVELGALDTPGEAFDVEVVGVVDLGAGRAGGELAYVADGRFGLRAIACSIGIQRAFSAWGQRPPEGGFRLRIGVHVGEPLPEEDRLFGVAVIAATRICDHAEAGTILVSEVVRELVAGGGATFVDRGRAELKGFPEPFHLYEVE